MAKFKQKSNTAWLWWLALLIIAAAAGFVYYIQQDPLNIHARQQINAIIAGASVAAGICIISATAHWWIRR